MQHGAAPCTEKPDILQPEWSDFAISRPVRTGMRLYLLSGPGLRYGEIRFGTLKNGGLSFRGTAQRRAPRNDASSLVRRRQ